MSTREFAVKSESTEDTFKDIAIYSTLAMILYRKVLNEQYAKEVLSEDGYKDWEDEGKPPLVEDKHGNVHTKEWTDKEIALQDRDNRTGLITSALPQFAYEHGANSHKYERTGKK